MEENIKEFEKIHKMENDLWSVIDKIYNSSEIQNLRLKGVVQNLGLELGFIVEQDKQMKKYKCERDKYKEILDKIKEYLNKVELGELENGKPYTFKDFLKEEIDAEIEEAKWLLELLEEIE